MTAIIRRPPSSCTTRTSKSLTAPNNLPSRISATCRCQRKKPYTPRGAAASMITKTSALNMVSVTSRLPRCFFEDLSELQGFCIAELHDLHRCALAHVDLGTRDVALAGDPAPYRETGRGE